MALIIEGAVDPEDASNNFLDIGSETSHIILLTDPPTEDSYLLVPVNAVPITLTTEVATKKKHKKVELPPLYTCKECNYTTSRLPYYGRHQETHWVVKKSDNENKNSSGENIPNKNSKDSVQYKCPHCSYYTSNIRSLRNHMHIHSHRNAYRCLDCKFQGKNLKELIIHHKQAKTLSCRFCTFSTHNKEMFKTHKENNHQAKWFGCTRCKFASADRGYLARHMKEHHSKAMRFDPIPSEPEIINYQIPVLREGG